MEQENRLEQNRYSKPFVGLSTAQEADSVTAGNDKEKKTKHLCGRQRGGQSDGNFNEEERRQHFIAK